MSSDQKDTNNSIEKLNETPSSSSLFPSTSFSSPGNPPPPPPPPLPSPRVRDIPARLCFEPALPNHALYNTCSNLQSPPLTRWRAGASTGVKKHQAKKQPKPQLESKPTKQSVKRPPPPPPLPQPSTLILKSAIPTPPRLTPKPALDEQLPSAVKKSLSTGESSTYALKDKRMKKSDDQSEDDKVEDDNSDDNSEMKVIDNQLALSGPSDIKTDQDDKGKELTSDRRLLRARHGGGGIKPQGDCSQPSMFTYRPVPISSEAPLNAVRPSFQPVTKSCTITTEPSTPSTFSAPTGESNLLSSNSQDSFKLVASGSAPQGQQMDQCVPTGLAVSQKEKCSTVAESTIASILMPPPPSKIPPGQSTLANEKKKPIFKPVFLTLQDQIRAACAILRRAEQIRNMTDPERRALVGNVLDALCGSSTTRHRLHLGHGTFVVLRNFELQLIGQPPKEQDTKPEKSDDQPE